MRYGDAKVDRCFLRAWAVGVGFDVLIVRGLMILMVGGWKGLKGVGGKTFIEFR